MALLETISINLQGTIFRLEVLTFLQALTLKIEAGMKNSFEVMGLLKLIWSITWA